MCKIVPEGTLMRYAANVKYMNPKRENIGGRYKTKIRPKETIDLTSGDKPIIRTNNATDEPISLCDDDQQKPTSSCASSTNSGMCFTLGC